MASTYFHGNSLGIGSATFDQEKFLSLPFAPGTTLEPQEFKESGGGFYRWCVVVTPPPTPGQIDRAAFEDAIKQFAATYTAVTLAYATGKSRVDWIKDHDEARARLDALVEPFLSAEGA